jgi:hypothetical protein
MIWQLQPCVLLLCFAWQQSIQQTRQQRSRQPGGAPSMLSRCGACPRCPHSPPRASAAQSPRSPPRSAPTPRGRSCSSACAAGLGSGGGVNDSGGGRAAAEAAGAWQHPARRGACVAQPAWQPCPGLALRLPRAPAGPEGEAGSGAISEHQRRAAETLTAS